MFNKVEWIDQINASTELDEDAKNFALYLAMNSDSEGVVILANGTVVKLKKRDD